MTQQMIKDRILALYQEKQNAGDLPSSQQLDGYYRLFRQKFGPEMLASLDGEVLLNLMHDFGTHDSLVYWLEFKNDTRISTHFWKHCRRECTEIWNFPPKRNRSMDNRFTTKTNRNFCRASDRNCPPKSRSADPRRFGHPIDAGFNR